MMPVDGVAPAREIVNVAGAVQDHGLAAEDEWRRELPDEMSDEDGAL